MRTLLMLTKRNMYVFLRNKSAVFFSLFSMMIIILLNLLFLGKLNIDEVVEMSGASRENAAFLVNSWLMAGIIVVNTVTVTLGVIGIMIEDEEKNTMLSFWVSPISRTKLSLGYILSSFIMGCIMCILTFAISEVYIVFTGGSMLDFMDIIKALLYIIINVFSSACFVFMLVNYIHSNGALNGLSIIVSTLIGFVGGIYIPIGSFPETIQIFAKCFPLVYGASIMRGIFSKYALVNAFEKAQSSMVTEYSDYMGISLSWNGSIVSDSTKVMVLIISGLVFMALSVIILKNRQVRDR